MLYRHLLSLLLPLACFATIIPRISFEEATNQSELIVTGDVVRNWCAWDDAHRYIWTHTEIAVRERWKGVSGPTVTVSEPGGEVGDSRLAVVGVVRYTPGERVVVFLYRTPIGYLRTTGLAQGKLHVDKQGLVHPALSSATVVTPSGIQAAGTSIGELEASPLTLVHARIARLAAAPKGAQR